MVPSDQEDLAALLAAASMRDQRAFAALYRQTSAHLFGLMLRMLKRRDWAEEALQDCFVKIWQRAGTYAPERGAPLAWLSTIARNRALDLLRARRPEDELPDDDTLATVDGRADPLADASTQQGIEALGECLGELSIEQRDSVLLAYYEGYTHQELSRRFRVPLGTVKSWVRRGLLRLRECLER